MIRPNAMLRKADSPKDPAHPSVHIEVYSRLLQLGIPRRVGMLSSGIAEGSYGAPLEQELLYRGDCARKTPTRFAASASGSFWYLRVFRQVFSTTCWISRRLYTSSPTKSESRPMLLCAPSLSPTYPQLQTMGKPGMAATVLPETAKGP